MTNLATRIRKRTSYQCRFLWCIHVNGICRVIRCSRTGEVKAQGVFKVLDIAVYNRKEEPITLDINNFKLIDGFGREYHISNEHQSVLKAANTSTFKFGIVNPDEHSDGNIVFDVPKNTRGLTLKFNNDKLDKELQLKVELE